MSFQENLRRYREAAGFSSARAFAESIGIPYTTYISYENKEREPKYETLCRIAAALGTTTDELLGHLKDPLAWVKSELSPVLKETGFDVLDYDKDHITFRRWEAYDTEPDTDTQGNYGTDYNPENPPEQEYFTFDFMIDTEKIKKMLESSRCKASRMVRGYFINELGIEFAKYQFKDIGNPPTPKNKK